MKLTSPDGSSLSLTIWGYQFPALEGEEYDSNWLLVRVDVKTPTASWSSTDPCLLTYEVAQLADWLEQLGTGRPPERTIGFIEPNLEFSVTEDKSAKEVLRTRLSLECRPPSVPRGGHAQIDFPLAEIDLKSAAADLLAQLRRYPPRASK